MNFWEDLKEDFWTTITDGHLWGILGATWFFVALTMVGIALVLRLVQ